MVTISILNHQFATCTICYRSKLINFGGLEDAHKYINWFHEIRWLIKCRHLCYKRAMHLNIYQELGIVQFFWAKWKLPAARLRRAQSSRCRESSTVRNFSWFFIRSLTPQQDFGELSRVAAGMRSLLQFNIYTCAEVVEFGRHAILRG